MTGSKRVFGVTFWALKCSGACLASSFFFYAGLALMWIVRWVQTGQLTIVLYRSPLTGSGESSRIDWHLAVNPLIWIIVTVNYLWNSWRTLCFWRGFCKLWLCRPFSIEKIEFNWVGGQDGGNAKHLPLSSCYISQSFVWSLPGHVLWKC